MNGASASLARRRAISVFPAAQGATRNPSLGATAAAVSGAQGGGGRGERQGEGTAAGGTDHEDVLGDDVLLERRGDAVPAPAVAQRHRHGALRVGLSRAGARGWVPTFNGAPGADLQYGRGAFPRPSPSARLSDNVLVQQLNHFGRGEAVRRLRHHERDDLFKGGGPSPVSRIRPWRTRRLLGAACDSSLVGEGDGAPGTRWPVV